MAERRTSPDLIKHLIDQIVDERRKIEDALEAIEEYSERLKQVAGDTGRRLLTKE